MNPSPSGILLIDKERGSHSFGLVKKLRRLLKVSKIGHAGTLDPFATGLMVMLIGTKYTRLSSHFLHKHKTYIARLKLGITTDTYDRDGIPVEKSEYIPSLRELEEAIKKFQGHILQVPPMYSAKKQNGIKLYDLARKGIVVERPPVEIELETTLLSYTYPFIDLKIFCSKGTYIRSIGHELGGMLHCGAHVEELRRTHSGSFSVENGVFEREIENGYDRVIASLQTSLDPF